MLLMQKQKYLCVTSRRCNIRRRNATFKWYCFLKQLIPQHPVPVVVVSSLNINVFEALSAGAVDFVRKPDMTKQNTVDAF